MSEDHGTPDPVEAQDSREDYVTPVLTGLGSFEELTQLTSGSGVDNEAFS